MARVHLFSSTPHNEKRRRISTTASSSLVDDNNNNNNNTNKHSHSNINELSRLAQLNRGPPPTLPEDTHALDITAVPSPTAHTTTATTISNSSSIHQPSANDNNRDTIMKDNTSPTGPSSNQPRQGTLPPTSISQNTTADMELVNAFAAALSGKFETFQMIWDKVRRGSTSGSGPVNGEPTDEGGQQSDDGLKGKDNQRTGSDNADIMDQEAAATALQLLGLASSSSPASTNDKQSNADTDKVKAADSSIPESGTHDDDTANATAAAAAAVLRQALSHQQDPQHHHHMQTQAPTNNNNLNSALSASMLMANYPGLTSPGGNSEGLDIQEEILQDYKRGTWTREEDDLLLLGIKRFGYGRWKEIASTIPGRKGKQLKQRWDNTLASKYVDAELLQNKLRNDDQITKLQQHLEGLASASNLSTAPAPSPPVPISIPTNNSSSTAQISGSTLPKASSSSAIHRVEPADWTEIAHKITEKVREGDQEAIEALLSQALLGTGHHMESSSTPPPAQQHQSSSSLSTLAHIKQEDHDNSHNTTTPSLSTPNTTNETASIAQGSTEPPSSHQSPNKMSPSCALENVNYSRSATPTSSSSPSVPTTTNNTSSSSIQQQHNTPVLNYADAAALSLYQQLSQHHATTTTSDADSNGSNNPLATIQALANNQYFLSNLFANVENGGNDATGAALAAAAAAAAAAMAHATSGGGSSTSTTTDASSLLASTMRSHLNTGNNNNSSNVSGGPGDSSNKDHHMQDRNRGENNTTSGNAGTPSDASLNQQPKRRRSDPALANTQSEAMSIYASSSPVTTMVNNQPQTVYPCLFPNCGKAFARLYNLKSHSRTHTDDRPFCCQLCNTAFSRNHDLKRHLKTHVGEKPYKCGGCQKTFSRLDALKRHKSNARNQAICLDT